MRVISNYNIHSHHIFYGKDGGTKMGEGVGAKNLGDLDLDP